MSRNEEKSAPQQSKPTREQRLKAALKANIARRKAQARARRDPGEEKES